MANVYSDNVHRDPEMTPNQKLRLTDDEMKLLRECNKESFYYRCIPFAATAMVATYLAVKKGYLRPNAKYGATLKVIGAAFSGWFLGKLSYRSKCEDKFLNLQNSVIADAVRKKRGYSLDGFNQEISQSSSEIILKPEDALSYSLDDGFSSSSYSSNQDADRELQYLDKDEKLSADSLSDLPVEDKPSRFVTTYDDLRQKTRAEYEQRQLKLYQPSQSSSNLPSATSRERDSSETKTQARQSTYGSGSTGIKNIYGDSWDK